jgi:hypothetical protein
MKHLLQLLTVFLILTSCHNQLRLVKVSDPAVTKNEYQELKEQKHGASAQPKFGSGKVVESLVLDEVEVLHEDTEDGLDILIDSELDNFEHIVVEDSLLQAESESSERQSKLSEEKREENKVSRYYFDLRDFLFWTFVYSFCAIWVFLPVLAILAILEVLSWIWVIIVLGGLALLSVICLVFTVRMGLL